MYEYINTPIEKLLFIGFNQIQRESSSKFMSIFLLISAIIIQMQKIEKWRIQELTIVLTHLTELLKRGNHTEWANVFSHYYYESQKLLLRKEFDLNDLKRLLQNIGNCFIGSSSFRNLTLWQDNQDRSESLNKEFNQVRSRLLVILAQMENQSVEYVN